jgi:hypothetical protein
MRVTFGVPDDIVAGLAENGQVLPNGTLREPPAGRLP